MRYIAFSTCSQICKHALQNERRAQLDHEVRKVLILQSFLTTREATRAEARGLVFDPFPYAVNAAPPGHFLYFLREIRRENEHRDVPRARSVRR